MAKKFLTHIDLNQNQLQNAQLDPRTGAPSSPVEGQIYYNSQQKKFFICTDDGTQSGHTVQWDTWGSGDGTITGISSTAPIKVNNGTTAVTSGSVAITHDTSGPSSSGDTTKGDTGNTRTLAFGDTFKVTKETVNKYGHTTSLSEITLTTPSSTATSSAAGLMSKEDKAKLDGLTDTMQFKGSIGGSGSGATITSLPTAAASNLGWAYQVITDGQYSGISAKVGDMIVCANTGTQQNPVYTWTLIPSGEQAKGTVTNVAAGNELTGGPITTSGTISHATKLGSNYTKTASSSSGGTFTLKIPNISVNTYGHVTSATDETVTVTMPSVSEQISRASGTISTSSTSCEITVGQSRTIYAVTAISNNAGVVVDWSYNSSTGKVTASVVSAPSAAVTVNVLYYGGGTVPSAVQMDYVVEMGTDNYWTWRKWNSGWAEAWGHFDTTFPAGTTNNRYGNLPKTSGSTQLFVYDPVINANVWMDSTASATVQFTEASVTRDQWTVYIQTTAGSGDKNTWIYLHLIGRWQTL